MEAKYQPCELVQTLPRVSKPFPQQKHFPKISPGEFFKTAAMQRGCCFCDPPPIPLEDLKRSYARDDRKQKQFDYKQE